GNGDLLAAFSARPCLTGVFVRYGFRDAAVGAGELDRHGWLRGGRVGYARILLWFSRNVERSPVKATVVLLHCYEISFFTDGRSYARHRLETHHHYPGDFVRGIGGDHCHHRDPILPGDGELPSAVVPGGVV